jgi:multiple sugar transport system substrate-binding protein
LLIASNLAPDIIFINNIDGQKYIKANILLNLNSYIKTDKNFSDKIFYKKTLDAFKYKNKLYAIPRDVSNLVIYYNKSLFDKYKIKYPSDNWTFKEFVETSKKLTLDEDKNGTIDVFGTGFETNPLFWLPFLWSNGGGIISNDGNKIILDSKNSIESIQQYSDLRNKYHVAPTAVEKGSMTMGQMFINQKIAMQINGRWAVTRFRKDLKFKWDIATFPAGTNGSVVDADASGWAISKDCKHPQLSWKFIKFMSNRKNIDNITKTGLIIPARKDSANSKIFIDNKNDPQNSRLFIAIIEKSVPTPASSNYNEILDIVNETLEPVWNGQLTAQKAINKKFADKVRKTFNESN